MVAIKFENLGVTSIFRKRSFAVLCFPFSCSEINLARNQFSGSIPSQLGMLTIWREMYLDQNQLTGALPTEMGLLTNLIALSVADNQLSGSIPSQLEVLIPRLSCFDAQNSNLVGAVPQPKCNSSMRGS